MKYVLIGLLKVWRLMVSPLYGNVCRYYPSCSAYALRAVSFHGAVKGSWLAGRRLLRCHPWAPGGYDPVPGTPEFLAEMQEVRSSAATMGSDARGTGDVEPVRPEKSAEPPQQQRTQGRRATVAQGRGTK